MHIVPDASLRQLQKDEGRQQRASPVVDAHHHLWRYTPEEFDWIEDRMASLRRDFSPVDLGEAMQSAGVDLAVAVQARQSLQETDMLLAAAAEQPRIAGVVGWLPLAEPAALTAALQRYAGASLLVGARHVVQGEPTGFLDGTRFNQGMAALQDSGLTYDLLLHAGQLQEAARFVDRHPRQAFVLDHLAKPRIAEGVLEPWASQIRELAQRDHVFCKLSGMVTEDDWEHWSLESLRPYLDAAVAAFGTKRLMAGSDWPVCLVATSYRRWWQTLRTYFADFSSDEQNAIFGGNAADFYRLNQTLDERTRRVNDADI